MESLIDSSIWIDSLRTATPDPARRIAHEAINRSSAVICEPIWYEMLRLAGKGERKAVEARLRTFPMLATPAELWRKATGLGQRCKDGGIQAGFADLLICTICAHHSAVLVSFDKHFVALAEVIGFEVDFLVRPR